MSDAPPKRRGRPKVAVPSVSLTTWVRSDDFDRIAKLAAKHDLSISGLARQLLLRRLPTDDPDR